jgi:hypothetical protein
MGFDKWHSVTKDQLDYIGKVGKGKDMSLHYKNMEWDKFDCSVSKSTTSPVISMIRARNSDVFNRNPIE